MTTLEEQFSQLEAMIQESDNFARHRLTEEMKSLLEFPSGPLYSQDIPAIRAQMKKASSLERCARKLSVEHASLGSWKSSMSQKVGSFQQEFKNQESALASTVKTLHELEETVNAVPDATRPMHALHWMDAVEALQHQKEDKLSVYAPWKDDVHLRVRIELIEQRLADARKIYDAHRLELASSSRAYLTTATTVSGSLTLDAVAKQQALQKKAAPYRELLQRTSPADNEGGDYASLLSAYVTGIHARIIEELDGLSQRCNLTYIPHQELPDFKEQITRVKELRNISRLLSIDGLPFKEMIHHAKTLISSSARERKRRAQVIASIDDAAQQVFTSVASDDWRSILASYHTLLGMKYPDETWKLDDTLARDVERYVTTRRDHASQLLSMLWESARAYHQHQKDAIVSVESLLTRPIIAEYVSAFSNEKKRWLENGKDLGELLQHLPPSGENLSPSWGQQEIAAYDLRLAKLPEELDFLDQQIDDVHWYHQREQLDGIAQRVTEIKAVYTLLSLPEEMPASLLEKVTEATSLIASAYDTHQRALTTLAQELDVMQRETADVDGASLYPLFSRLENIWERLSPLYAEEALTEQINHTAAHADTIAGTLDGKVKAMLLSEYARPIKQHAGSIRKNAGATSADHDTLTVGVQALEELIPALAQLKHPRYDLIINHLLYHTEQAVALGRKKIAEYDVLFADRKQMLETEAVQLEQLYFRAAAIASNDFFANAAFLKEWLALGEAFFSRLLGETPAWKKDPAFVNDTHRIEEASEMLGSVITGIGNTLETDARASHEEFSRLVQLPCLTSSDTWALQFAKGVYCLLVDALKSIEPTDLGVESSAARFMDDHLTSIVKESPSLLIAADAAIASYDLAVAADRKKIADIQQKLSQLYFPTIEEKKYRDPADISLPKRGITLATYGTTLQNLLEQYASLSPRKEDDALRDELRAIDEQMFRQIKSYHQMVKPVINQLRVEYQAQEKAATALQEQGIGIMHPLRNRQYQSLQREVDEKKAYLQPLTTILGNLRRLSEVLS
ncbi:hypothetical protein HZB02_02420 [Candidatus Woesearchaeota archaeon]|nr:hypothetical protein [Candidatus Woesearchaeota archaeon]